MTRRVLHIAAAIASALVLTAPAAAMPVFDSVVADDPGGGWCRNGDYWWQPSPAPGFYFCINHIPVYLGP